MREYWEDTLGTKTWEKTAMGEGKQEGNELELFPPLLQPPRDSSVQHSAHLGLPGAVMAPLETPGWSFQLTRELPAST